MSVIYNLFISSGCSSFEALNRERRIPTLLHSAITMWKNVKIARAFKSLKQNFKFRNFKPYPRATINSFKPKRPWRYRSPPHLRPYLMRPLGPVGNACVEYFRRKYKYLEKSNT